MQGHTLWVQRAVKWTGWQVAAAISAVSHAPFSWQMWLWQQGNRSRTAHRPVGQQAMSSDSSRRKWVQATGTGLTGCGDAERQVPVLAPRIPAQGKPHALQPGENGRRTPTWSSLARRPLPQVLWALHLTLTGTACSARVS